MSAVAWADMTADDRKEVSRLLRKSARLERQQQLAVVAVEHDVACFKCGSRLNPWAKVDEKNGRWWGICSRCVRGVDGAGPRLRSASAGATQRTGAARTAPPLREHPGIGEANPFHEEGL